MGVYSEFWRHCSLRVQERMGNWKRDLRVQSLGQYFERDWHCGCTLHSNGRGGEADQNHHSCSECGGHCCVHGWAGEDIEPASEKVGVAPVCGLWVWNWVCRGDRQLSTQDWRWDSGGPGEDGVNIPSLETSRLSYWRKLKTMTVPKMEGEERPSKALKCDIPQVTVATLDSAPEGTAVFLVGKLRAVTPQDVVVNVISFSANSMKFAAEIEADNAQARVDWWSNEAGFKELFGEGVPWTDLWERCETQEGLVQGRGFTGNWMWKGVLVICERSQAQTVQELGAYHGSLSRFDSVDLLQAFAARAWASLSVHVSGKVFGSGQCMPQRWREFSSCTATGVRAATKPVLIFPNSIWMHASGIPGMVATQRCRGNSPDEQPGKKGWSRSKCISSRFLRRMGLSRFLSWMSPYLLVVMHTFALLGGSWPSGLVNPERRGKRRAAFHCCRQCNWLAQDIWRCTVSQPGRCFETGQNVGISIGFLRGGVSK